MKYQALRPHFFSMGWWWWGVVCWWGMHYHMLWVVDGGWVVSDAPHHGGGTWCPPMLFLFLEKTMHLIGKIIFVLRKNNIGGIPGASGVSDTPYDAPMFFFDNLVKELDNLSISNIDIYPSTLEICINNLLILFFFRSGPHPDPIPETTLPPLKIILMPNIFNKNQHIYLQSMLRLSFQSNAYSFNMKYTNIRQNWCLS